MHEMLKRYAYRILWTQMDLRIGIHCDGIEDLRNFSVGVESFLTDMTLDLEILVKLEHNILVGERPRK